MKAANYNLFINQGSTFSTDFLLQDQSGPIDLTGYVFSGKIKETTGTASVATMVFTLANQFTNPGKFNASISAANTALIDCGTPTVDNPRPSKTYIYDIEAVKPDLSVQRYLQGQVVVSAEVTT